MRLYDLERLKLKRDDIIEIAYRNYGPTLEYYRSFNKNDKIVLTSDFKDEEGHEQHRLYGLKSIRLVEKHHAKKKAE